jgi:exopolysaccharide biosynthesis protein
MITVDMNAVKCQIATAVMVGANKAPLATIAVENYGVIGGINGGYFAGAKPIGVLRRQGYTENAKFWPQRSAFGWNDNGETVFIDGRETADISSDRRFDKYTEMLQAGPLLLKNGEYMDNTENIKENVLNMRHPRTIVGTDDNRIMWAVIDGRDNMHSVGATIEETRKICRWLGMSTALNLDGGGSSSLWWMGNTFTLPSNSNDAERPIPYGVLIFREGSGVRN